MEQNNENTVENVIESAVEATPVIVPTGKKNAYWVKFDKYATVNMPSGLSHEFDFSKMSMEIFAYYGRKQWLSDKMATSAGTSDKDRLDLMIEAYNDAITKGVELTGEGRIAIIGKDRANAKPKTVDSLVLAKLATMSVEDCKSAVNMAKLGFMKFSPELLAEIKVKAGIVEVEEVPTEGAE